MKPFERSGLWWTVNNPSEKVAGKLTFDDDNGIVLSLIGTLGKATTLPEAARFLGEKNHPIILGMCDDSTGSGNITLVGCTQQSYLIGSPGFAQESYFVEKAFLGACSRSQETSRLRTVTFGSVGFIRGPATGRQSQSEGIKTKPLQCW